MVDASVLDGRFDGVVTDWCRVQQFFDGRGVAYTVEPGTGTITVTTAGGVLATLVFCECGLLVIEGETSTTYYDAHEFIAQWDEDDTSHDDRTDDPRQPDMLPRVQTAAQPAEEVEY